MVFEGLGAVQELGQTNMLDYDAVCSPPAWATLRLRCGLLSTTTNTLRAYFVGS